MRILLTTLGSRGDVEPFLRLAHALQRRAHEVRVIAPDDVDAEAEGLDVVGLGLRVEDLAVAQDVRQAMRVFRERIKPAMSRALASVVAEAMRWQPDVIVSHPKLLTVPAVASRLEIPHVLVELTPVVTATGAFPAAGTTTRDLGPTLNRMTYRLVALSARMFRDDVAMAARRLGLGRAPALPAPARTLVPISPALLPRPDDWPPHTSLTGDWGAAGTPIRVDDELETFLADDAPFVYAGFGSMTGGDAAVRGAAIVESARRRGLRVLVSTGWGGLAVPARAGGDDVLVRRAVPHDAVLPGAQVAVHHGGAGTVHAATRAGAPSVVVPFLADQPFWADRLHRAGLAGRPLPRNGLTTKNVGNALDDAAGRRGAVADAAAVMSAERGVEAAAAIIESL
ncbi:glycosyltransferase [Microbacterium marinilacus]|uniref:Glycosyltransferase n=1 Tax=Microbacterium marinilacus TaxID=415209 RepID=A0ABP7BVQ6_9MICO|nr:glycosyltransferase [Microbacterium marinilacus]MBY0688035.1 glycosyltransferase [Microbacterium marinilacus]